MELVTSEDKTTLRKIGRKPVPWPVGCHFPDVPRLVAVVNAVNIPNGNQDVAVNRGLTGVVFVEENSVPLPYGGVRAALLQPRTRNGEFSPGVFHEWLRFTLAGF
jgi:hypothetical protein